MPLVIMTTGTGAFSVSHRRSMAQSTPAELMPSTIRSVSLPSAVANSSWWKAVTPSGSLTLSFGWRPVAFTLSMISRVEMGADEAHGVAAVARAAGTWPSP